MSHLQAPSTLLQGALVIEMRCTQGTLCVFVCAVSVVSCVFRVQVLLGRDFWCSMFCVSVCEGLGNSSCFLFGIACVRRFLAVCEQLFRVASFN